MTNLEKALIERVEKLEKDFDHQIEYSKDTFNQVVNLSDALSSIEDFLCLETTEEGSRYICMKFISECGHPNEFAKAYDYFKYIIDPPKEAKQEKTE